MRHIGKQRQIQADEIMDIESVPEKQTSALEVTIPETDLENTEKLEALQKIARANRGERRSDFTTHDSPLRRGHRPVWSEIQRCA